MRKCAAFLLLLPFLSTAASLTCPGVNQIQYKVPAPWTVTLIPADATPYQPLGQSGNKNPYKFAFARIITMLSNQNTIICHYNWKGNGTYISLYLTQDGRYKPSSSNWGGSPKECVQNPESCAFIPI